ncbi:hypothetical protein M7I_0259 [Glarea lozoyensis 74030]|uniref:Uncharacterized protein n=1 Tax=Glarea lozoyensis (strain ATCC 74030 / MF5533) TaxID=1104152 RepID=H0ECW3_GLAL7|nr:hypothetical protein M7I_0259 [Glarea lozoyensis 74030]
MFMRAGPEVDARAEAAMGWVRDLVRVVVRVVIAEKGMPPISRAPRPSVVKTAAL